MARAQPPAGPLVPPPHAPRANYNLVKKNLIGIPVPGTRARRLGRLWAGYLAFFGQPHDQLPMHGPIPLEFPKAILSFSNWAAPDMAMWAAHCWARHTLK